MRRLVADEDEGDPYECEMGRSANGGNPKFLCLRSTTAQHGMYKLRSRLGRHQQVNDNSDCCEQLWRVRYRAGHVEQLRSEGYGSSTRDWPDGPLVTHFHMGYGMSGDQHSYNLSEQLLVLGSFDVHGTPALDVEFSCIERKEHFDELFNPRHAEGSETHNVEVSGLRGSSRRPA